MEAVTRGTGVSIWRQIETALAQKIATGALRQGIRMPSEPELASAYGVNRHTVRRALAALAERGLVRIEQGRGTFVQEHAIDYAIKKRTRFRQSMVEQNLNSEILVIDAVEQPATREVASALELEIGTPVYRIDTTSQVDGRVLDHSTMYLPVARFAGFPSVYRRVHSVTTALAEFGITDYTRKSTRVTARLPRPDTATHLKQPTTRPVLYVQSVNVDDAGKAIQYGIARFAGDWVQLVFEPEH